MWHILQKKAYNTMHIYSKMHNSKIANIHVSTHRMLANEKWINFAAVHNSNIKKYHTLCLLYVAKLCCFGRGPTSSISFSF